MNKINAVKLLIVLCLLIVTGCKNDLPVVKDLQNKHFKFVNQDGHDIIFPNTYNGKIVILGLIFTNCPDICPMITNNMTRIQERLKKENINDVEFVSVSFDPQRDTPFVLKQYAEVRDINTDQWDFLTGRQNTVDSLKKLLNYMAIAGDTAFTPEGKPYYFFVHTDRLTLMDREGRVRKNYRGSEINLEQIVADIKSLG